MGVDIYVNLSKMGTHMINISEALCVRHEDGDSYLCPGSPRKGDMYQILRVSSKAQEESLGLHIAFFVEAWALDAGQSSICCVGTAEQVQALAGTVPRGL